MKMAQIRIKNLRTRAIIGAYEEERKKKQEIIINVVLDFDAKEAIKSDTLSSSVDYADITKRIMENVEQSTFFLLEKLADSILKVVMKDKRVLRANVEVDKPHALDHADSVSVSVSSE